ncbi:RNA/RNP complex-1-interacting phosphatase [Polypterus senegalus]|uniref:RNA/RNP complex-1-interacting phosphatase n=1 Tax=Polypterus senegalus TaxID=55291 RepID=UPI001964B795|nr:RNA/RNP complex-1-interacting phosphatase [Polypterus senegalus]
MKGKKNHPPDRWTEYLAVGKRIPGTRFVAFKVPLKQTFERYLAPNERFSVLDLVETLKEGKEDLGLIIDLTFTSRYYNPQNLPENISYVKIYTAGHEVPNDSTILQFKQAVTNFLKENAENDMLIGVHCTHGLNRTGYLICRYLIDVEDMNPQRAIDLFNSSRGHSIERQNYIEDLQSGPKRSNEEMDKSQSDLQLLRDFGRTRHPNESSFYSDHSNHFYRPPHSRNYMTGREPCIQMGSHSADWRRRSQPYTPLPRYIPGADYTPAPHYTSSTYNYYNGQDYFWHGQYSAPAPPNLHQTWESNYRREQQNKYQWRSNHQDQKQKRT